MVGAILKFMARDDGRLFRFLGDRVYLENVISKEVCFTLAF